MFPCFWPHLFVCLFCSCWTATCRLLCQLEKKFTHYVGAAAAAVKLFLIGPTFGCLFVFLFPGFVFCCHLLLICWCVQLCFIDLIHLYVCSIVFLFASFSFLFVGLFVGFIWQVWATFYLRPQKLKTIAMNNCLHLTSGCKSFTSFFFTSFLFEFFVSSFPRKIFRYEIIGLHSAAETYNTTVPSIWWERCAENKCYFETENMTRK